MNITRLIEMIKDLTKEAYINEQSHSSRYNRGRSMKSATKMPTKSQKAFMKKPDVNPQLAEQDKDNKPSGKTDTGKPANKINVEPSYYSQIEPTRGGAHKPQIDTK